MNDFGLWLSFGFQHILDLDGYDHILFVTLLVTGFPPKQWKEVLGLITAFTVGHSLSLALSVLKQIKINQPLIELLIALSILITAFYQLWKLWKDRNPRFAWLFCTVIFFGLIHGLGFSFLLRSMLGKLESPILPLLYFNVGLELGQLIIVVLVWLFSLFLAGPLNISHKKFHLIIVCLIFLIALKITAERLMLLSD